MNWDLQLCLGFGTVLSRVGIRAVSMQARNNPGLACLPCADGSNPLQQRHLPLFTRSWSDIPICFLNMAEQSGPVQTCEWRCGACREIHHGNWDEWLGPGQFDAVDHHESIHALGEAARLGCRLCRVFWWSLFQYSDSSALYDAHEVPEGKCSVRVSMLPTGRAPGEPASPLGIKFKVGSRVVFIKEKSGSIVGASSWNSDGDSAEILELDDDSPSVRRMVPIHRFTGWQPN